MVWLVILSQFLIFTQYYAQGISSSSAAVILNVTVKDNTGKAQGIKNLQFGLDSAATDGIDSQLGEASLPPLPPSGIMDARFILPNNESTLSDFRFGTSLYDGEKAYILQYQPGEGGKNINIIWDLPVNVRGMLQDVVTGNLISAKMEGRDSLVISDPSVFSKLRMTISYHITSVMSDIPISLQPHDYCLYQNYPNPFNPSTVISYSIPEDEFVTIKVYNILGKEISTLVNYKMPAGNHVVSFNPVNLAAGTYFYRITAGNYSETKKMLYLK